MSESLTPIRKQILEFIVASQREHQFPPSIREIGLHVGLRSTASVQSHINNLVAAGFITRNPQQPRTLTVHLEGSSTTPLHSEEQRSRLIPFVGDVAAGLGVLAEETSREMISLPETFAGRGDSFMLQVRGESMINAAILPGDFVVVQREVNVTNGDIVVAGILGDEATVKRYFLQGNRVILTPENDSMEPMEFSADDVVIYGRVISVLRSY
ncbi:MAG: transcriptional repressor LexA [Actinomycetota bacterium]|jgi:repressor LexA